MVLFSKKLSFPYLRRKVCRFVESFFKNISKNVFLTIRRNRGRFDQVFPEKSFTYFLPFHIYGDFMALLGACFWKKVLFFVIRRFRCGFGPPLMEKYPFHFYGDLEGVLGRCFWKKFCFSLYGDFSAVLEPPLQKNKPSHRKTVRWLLDFL